MSNKLPQVVTEFLEAVNARDAPAVGRCLTDDVVYQFLVPQPPTAGRDGVQAAFAAILGETSHVQWDVVASATAGDHVFVERVDRFWYGEREVAIECNGVFELAHGRIAEVRDYADLATWRERKKAARADG